MLGLTSDKLIETFNSLLRDQFRGYITSLACSQLSILSCEIRYIDSVLFGKVIRSFNSLLRDQKAVPRQHKLTYHVETFNSLLRDQRHISQAV